MENAGLRITVQVFREDKSVAQEIIFDQRGMSYTQLLELQQKAIMPCVDAVRNVADGWGKAAMALDAAKKSEGRFPTPGPTTPKG